MVAGFAWKDFERAPGQWDTKHEQTMHAFTDLARSYGLEPIALIGRGIPTWAQAQHLKGPAAPPDESFLQQVRQKQLTEATSSFIFRLDCQDRHQTALENWKN